jgi:hypothetical protein
MIFLAPAVVKCNMQCGHFLFIISFVRELCCVRGNTFQLVTVYLHSSCFAAVCLVDGPCELIERRVREQTDVIPKTRLHTIDTPDLGRHILGQEVRFYFSLVLLKVNGLT